VTTRWRVVGNLREILCSPAHAKHVQKAFLGLLSFYKYRKQESPMEVRRNESKKMNNTDSFLNRSATQVNSNNQASVLGLELPAGVVRTPIVPGFLVPGGSGDPPPGPLFSARKEGILAREPPFK